jgi:hypothetical protein
MTTYDRNLDSESAEQKRLRFLNRSSKKFSTGDTLALFAVGTFGLHILSFFVLLLLYGSYSQLSKKAPPTLVQLETGKSIKVASIGSLERTPQVVLRFVSDTMTLMMNWSGTLPPSTVEEAAKPKPDPGVDIRSLGNRQSKVAYARGRHPTLYQKTFAKSFYR